MRNTIYQTIKLCLLICLIIFVGCQKEESNSPTKNCPVNVSSLSGNYSITSLRYKPAGDGAEHDWMQFMDPCERDDIVFLSSNGTYNHMDKGQVCSPDGNETGTWSLNGRIITSDGYINGTIEKFDCKVLVIYILDIFAPGDRMTFTFTRE